MVAHEMRVPLASISLAVKGLKRINTAHSPANTEKIQSHIEQLVSHSQTTIDMLLFRLGQSTGKSEFTQCSLKSCIEEAIDEYPFEQGEKEKISFVKEENIIFFGDKRLFVHVIFNLIKNALHAINQTNKGYIDISIDSSNNILSFKDTAKGINTKQLKKLFKEFHTTKSDGTGMGLFFCKQVITQMGGDISCLSKEGQFTEFLLTFPRNKVI